MPVRVPAPAPDEPALWPDAADWPGWPAGLDGLDGPDGPDGPDAAYGEAPSASAPMPMPVPAPAPDEPALWPGGAGGRAEAGTSRSGGPPATLCTPSSAAAGMPGDAWLREAAERTVSTGAGAPAPAAGTEVGRLRWAAATDAARRSAGSAATPPTAAAGAAPAVGPGAGPQGRTTGSDAAGATPGAGAAAPPAGPGGGPPGRAGGSAGAAAPSGDAADAADRSTDSEGPVAASEGVGRSPGRTGGAGLASTR